MTRLPNVLILLAGLFLAGLFLAGLALTATPAAAGEKLTVVELFTSQGCSSCPPADSLVGELAERDDVLALSFHVDYWDYIGWKDPYASPRHTRRQKDYRSIFKLRYVYTPQIVIQGTEQKVGSDRSAILKAIDKVKDLPTVPVRLKSAGGDNDIVVAIPARASAETADILMVVFDRKHETPVKRGENEGRTLKNFNVVRAMRRLGTWRGEAVEIPARLSDMGYSGGDVCAVLLQSRDSGRILGAAMLPINRNN